MNIPSIEEFWSLPINEELCDFYKSMICSLTVSDETKQKFSVPLLMQSSPGYASNPRNGVFFVGQETCGWGGSSETVGQTYESFLRDSSRERRMMEAQSDFIINRYGKSNHKKSPLWRAFREVVQVSDEVDAAYRPFLWSNIMACDYEGHSFLNCLSAKEENEFIDFSKRKFLGELAILKPKICLLFTGPDYDFVLERYFNLPQNWKNADIRSFRECPDSDGSSLVYVKTFDWSGIRFIRTYHPGYLQRKSLWKIVEIISQTVCNMLK